MTYEQYWYGDVLMVRAFREADKLRQQRMNEQAWLQGMYIYNALVCVAPVLHAFAKKGTKPAQYPAKPYGIQDDERQRTEEEERRIAENERLKSILFFRNWANSVSKKFEQK